MLSQRDFLDAGVPLYCCAGIWLAFEFYRTKRFAPELVAAKWPRLYQLLLHKYYVDEIYDAAIVERTKDLELFSAVSMQT